MATDRKLRCAVYTRKSTEEGLEMEYNSLDAQYDSAVSYIKSQASNGWTLLPKHYDDGGFSGGNVNRPALQELMKDIESDKIDIVVVYKIDRLSRSLCDFTDLLKIFEAHHVSFVSVTQQIDTSNAAGRMMLHVLISFAQYERETITDRIRDKVYATMKKGMWYGGVNPFGYKVVDKHLIVEPETAEIVRFIFKRYAELGSAKTLAAELQCKFGSKCDNQPWRMQQLYRILRNPIYKGMILHKRSGQLFKGIHEGIVEESLWEDCNRILGHQNGEQPSVHRESAAILKGLLRCGHCGGAMSPAFSNKRSGVRYSYYRCVTAGKVTHSTCPVKNISAELIEREVIAQLGVVMKSPEFIKLTASEIGVSEREVAASLSDIPGFINDLFPPERDRLLHCLIDHVTVSPDGLDIEFKNLGMDELIKEIRNGNDN